MGNLMIMTMTLDKYLLQEGITPAEFSDGEAFSERAVIKWKRGERNPCPKFLDRITEKTKGQVTANDCYQKYLEFHRYKEAA